MRLVLKPLTCRSGIGWVRSVSRVIRGLACGSWLLILGLAGCAGKPAPQVQYVRVEVPVQVPCRAPQVAEPPWVAADLRKIDSLELKVRSLLAERRQRIGYERQLKAATDACR